MLGLAGGCGPPDHSDYGFEFQGQAFCGEISERSENDSQDRLGMKQSSKVFGIQPTCIEPYFPVRAMAILSTVLKVQAGKGFFSVVSPRAKHPDKLSVHACCLLVRPPMLTGDLSH